MNLTVEMKQIQKNFIGANNTDDFEHILNIRILNR